MRCKKYGRKNTSAVPRRSSPWPLPWSAHPSKASSGCLHSTGTPSSAYFEHHDAVYHRASWRSAQKCTQALICRLVREGADYEVKFGNGDSCSAPTDFISTSTAFIAQPDHCLIACARSPLHQALTRAAIDMCPATPRASSSSFSACIAAYLVDREPLV